MAAAKYTSSSMKLRFRQLGKAEPRMARIAQKEKEAAHGKEAKSLVVRVSLRFLL
jgi:hypothetical protein